MTATNNAHTGAVVVDLLNTDHAIDRHSSWMGAARSSRLSRLPSDDCHDSVAELDGLD